MTTAVKPSPIADYLDYIGSHTIMDERAVNALARFGFGIKHEVRDGHLFVGLQSPWEAALPWSEEGQATFFEFDLSTHDQMIRRLKADPRGGTLGPEPYPGAWYTSGFELARAVWRCLVPIVAPPGDRFFGRGTAFRANVAAIREYEQSR